MKRPITPFQKAVYLEWLLYDCQFRPTAKALGRQPEQIRQAVASVQNKRLHGEPFPAGNVSAIKGA